MPDSDTKFGFKFQRGINIQTTLAVILILVSVVWAWADTQRDIEILDSGQQDFEVFEVVVMEKFGEYVSQEQLQYIVVDRIDRLDDKLDRRLLELETKIQEQLNRIEEKIDQ